MSDQPTDRETTERPIQPGRGLDLLPKAPIPDDMHWARPNPRIAGALARWAAAVDREAARAVSPRVRQLVLSRLESWHGEKPITVQWRLREPVPEHFHTVLGVSE